MLKNIITYSLVHILILTGAYFYGKFLQDSFAIILTTIASILLLIYNLIGFTLLYRSGSSKQKKINLNLSILVITFYFIFALSSIVVSLTIFITQYEFTDKGVKDFFINGSFMVLLIFVNLFIGINLLKVLKKQQKYFS